MTPTTQSARARLADRWWKEQYGMTRAALLRAVVAERNHPPVGPPRMIPMRRSA